MGMEWVILVHISLEDTFTEFLQLAWVACLGPHTGSIVPGKQVPGPVCRRCKDEQDRAPMSK